MSSLADSLMELFLCAKNKPINWFQAILVEVKTVVSNSRMTHENVVNNTSQGRVPLYSIKWTLNNNKANIKYSCKWKILFISLICFASDLPIAYNIFMLKFLFRSSLEWEKKINSITCSYALLLITLKKIIKVVKYLTNSKNQMAFTGKRNIICHRLGNYILFWGLYVIMPQRACVTHPKQGKDGRNCDC